MLKVENLTKVYPNGTQALKNVSFEVKDGEFLAVIGLSGSGKSTLLRCINRLIEPTSGKIYWDGQDVTAIPISEMRKIRRQIGMIFQQFNLVKRSSVLTNVLSGRLGYVNTFSSSLHLFAAADRAKALASLEQVGLANKAHVRADSLSGGQQQKDRGITVLCSLHFLDLVHRYATSAIALKDGELVFQGLPKQIDDSQFKAIYGQEAERVSIV